MKLKSTNLKTSSIITSRSKSPEDKFIRSISIMQTDGSFVVSYPFKNEVTWYPQSPNNPTASSMQEIKTFTSFTNYGNLYFPLDAKVDYIRKNLYIADTGNSRVLKVDLTTGAVVNSYGNIAIPIAIAININTDEVFIRSVAPPPLQGMIFHYRDNVAINGFVFFSNSAYPLTIDGYFVKNIPTTSSMAFDNTRNRLWWIANANVFMFDVPNNNVVMYNLGDEGYSELESIDIDTTTGNAFITGLSGIWSIAQMSRDNNVFLGSSTFGQIA